MLFVLELIRLKFRFSSFVNYNLKYTVSTKVKDKFILGSLHYFVLKFEAPSKGNIPIQGDRKRHY